MIVGVDRPATVSAMQAQKGDVNSYPIMTVDRESLALFWLALSCIL